MPRRPPRALRAADANRSGGPGRSGRGPVSTLPVSTLPVGGCPGPPRCSAVRTHLLVDGLDLRQHPAGLGRARARWGAGIR